MQIRTSHVRKYTGEGLMLLRALRLYGEVCSKKQLPLLGNRLLQCKLLEKSLYLKVLKKMLQR